MPPIVLLLLLLLVQGGTADLNVQLETQIVETEEGGWRSDGIPVLATNSSVQVRA
jgi:hypothetical protein